MLVVTNDFPPKVGGINYYVSEIARRFPPGEMTVFASNWPGAAGFDADFPQRVVRWPARTLLPTPAAYRAVARLVRDERPDLLLFGACVPLALLGRPIQRRFGTAYATFTHGVEIAASRLPIGRTFLRSVGHSAALVTAVSHWTARRLAPFIGPRTRLEVLPSGIDAPQFRPDVSADAIVARHGLGPGPILCCVSRLVARKGQDQVIRALPQLAAEWPDIRFLIVGGGPDEQRLRTLATRQGVSERVVFAGEVPYVDLPAYFRCGEIFVMPCRSRFLGFETEALGAVYLQAAAVGRPVIAGDAGGAPEGVRRGETGLVVDGTSVPAIRAAIADLLRDPVRADVMGRAGADWVHRALTWETIARDLQAMLSECVGRSTG
ncbi:MAG: glycosyltransferase family 4 protein [Acidobacteriota bacterium]